MRASELLLIAVGAWYAVNMGGSGIAPAFGATLGARLISARWAALWFGAFVIAGALLFGSNVAKTLSSGLVPDTSFDLATTLVVMCATNVALLIANLVGIPQSTSWVTVAAIIALGAVDGDLTTHTLTHRLLPAWILLPIAGFVLSALAVRFTYPLTGWALHAWFGRRARVLRGVALASSCYVAFAIGANNVANAVGPISAARVFDLTTGMWLLAPAFGVGAFVLRAPARMIGRDLVPLGLLTATICNLIVASLLLVASHLGLPQSLVQLNAAAVLGVALIKEGPRGMFRGRGARRMLVLWIAAPIVAALLTAAGLEVLR